MAIIKTYLEATAGRPPDGELPIRRNHSLKVFRREAGGWRIVSDIYMDAREDETFVAVIRQAA